MADIPAKKRKWPGMLLLHHHADPEVEIYVRNREIVALDARWEKIEEE